MNFSDEMFEDGFLEREYGGISNFPVLSRYIKMYGKSLEGNDKKALSLFKFYETKEQQKRLETELLQIKKEMGSNAVLRNLLGRKRESRHGSFSEWGKMMLLWFSEAKEG